MKHGTYNSWYQGRGSNSGPPNHEAGSHLSMMSRGVKMKVVKFILSHCDTSGIGYVMEKKQWDINKMTGTLISHFHNRTYIIKLGSYNF
jgi:hypothetical protein